MDYDVIVFPGGHDKGVKQIIESESLRVHLNQYFPYTKEKGDSSGRKKVCAAIWWEWPNCTADNTEKCMPFNMKSGIKSWCHGTSMCERRERQIHSMLQENYYLTRTSGTTSTCCLPAIGIWRLLSYLSRQIHSWIGTKGQSSLRLLLYSLAQQIRSWRTNPWYLIRNSNLLASICRGHLTWRPPIPGRVPML